MAFQNHDTYQTITDKIIAALEKGVRPWAQPWKGGVGAAMPLRHNGKPYNGINVLVLWLAAEEQGFQNPTWMTLKQANKYGGHVRKGSKGTLICYTDKIRVKQKDRDGKFVREDDGSISMKEIFLMKGSIVFNVEQIEKLPERFQIKTAPVAEDRKGKLERVAATEEFFAALKSDVRHGGSRAYFNIANDFIGMPRFEDFTDAESYYATLAHEHVHWTGAKKRLDREFGKRFGDQAYAFEELVAEMGAAFLCVKLGVTMTPREDHASYLDHWLGVLKQDKKAIFTAATAAKKAVQYLDDAAAGKVPTTVQDNDEVEDDESREAA